MKNLILMAVAALAISACSHKEHKHDHHASNTASCCDTKAGKTECAMDKKDCAHCAEKEATASK